MTIALIGSKRGWSFRRIAAAIIGLYGVGLSLVVAAGLGIRGWWLVFMVVAVIVGGAVAALLWERVLEIGKEEAERRRKKASR